jgi:hypothetical protein
MRETNDSELRNSPYQDVDRLRTADNMVAVISQRRKGGELTFCIFREFERDGRTEHTAFIGETMTPQYLELAQLAIERMSELARDPSRLPFPRR